MVTTSG